MLLTRPRRKVLFGIGFGLLWLLFVISFWGMTETERADAPPGKPYFTITTCRLGLIEWMTIKAYDSAVPTGVVTSYSFEYHVFGIVCGVAWTLLSGWLLYLWWPRAVASSLVKPTLCDTCGYDLSRIGHDTCPECGRINPRREERKSIKEQLTSHWYWFVVAFFATLWFATTKGPIPLLLVTNMDQDLKITVIMWSMMLPLMGIFAFCIWCCIQGVIRQTGNEEFKGRKDTPRTRCRIFAFMAWTPLALVLIVAMIAWGMAWYRPGMYGDVGPLGAYIRYGSIAMILGIAGQSVLTRRVRAAARRAGICFRCAAPLSESKGELCEDCEGRST